MKLEIYEGVGAVLDKVSPLTSYDYEYLNGQWDGPPGAAYNIVAEWCQNHGYGQYGKPTVRGKTAMEEYVRKHTL